MKLRPYQNRAVNGVYQSLRTNRSCILQQPTGSGKTFISMHMIMQGLKHGRRITFGVDRLTLLDQTLDRFYESGIPFGVVQGDHPMQNATAPVQIASVQTLQRRGKKNWPISDLYIFDEVHTNYSVIGEMINTWDRLKYIGLSATPFTRGLGRIWDDLYVATTTKELIDEGYLAEYEAYGPSTPDLSGIRYSGNDYSTTDLEERMNELTGDIVAHYQKYGNGGKGLYFTPTVAYAQTLADEFNSSGIIADHVSGYDTPERRRRIMKLYSEGAIDVLANCDVLTKGFDESDIMVGGLARPTRSLSLHIQMLGRFLRRHGDSVKTILDHSGNIERLGFPDDPLPTTLDMGTRGVNPDTRERDEPQPWNCPKCTFLVPPGTSICPCCGHQVRRKAKVEVKTGVLGKLERTSELSGKFLRQDVFSQLNWICRERGYKPNWAAYQYQKIFASWPNGMNGSMKEPTPEIISWVKSRDIAYAHRRPQ